MEALGALGTLIVGIFLFVLAVLWFILPFIVMGIKNRLDNTNQLLEHISNNTAYTLHEMKKLTHGQGQGQG